MTGNCDNTKLIPATSGAAAPQLPPEVAGPIARARAPRHKTGMARFLILLLLLGAGPAVAGPDRASLLIGSRHIDPRGQFEEVNPGLFLTWEGRLDLTLGVYRNSYGRTSTAAMLGLPLWRRGEAEVEAFAGLAHYPVNGREFLIHVGDVVPLGGLQLRWRNLFGQVIPLDGGVADAVVTFGVTFGLD